jgi:hypothetical protein
MPPRMSAPPRQSAWPPYIENRAESKPVPKTPANSNVLGVWENGVFRFNSPEAKETWDRESYEQGVNSDTWSLGKEIDAQSAGLAQAGLAGTAMPGLYRGPDGKYRLMNLKTIESEAARDHRNRHLKGMKLEQLETATKMPGADVWVEKRKTARNSINDGAVGIPSATSSATALNDIEMKFQLPVAVPGRFAAMKRISDARIADKHDIQRPAGKWEGDSFFFDSLEDHQRWARAAYRQRVSADNWHLGKVVDSKYVDNAAANPGLYRAPDGTYRLVNNQTTEGEAASKHRNQYLAEKAIAQVANGESVPGEDEWVEKWTSAWKKERPDLGHRFGAATKRTIVDGSITGDVVQQFASGYALNPDTLATRANDAFSHSGSHGRLEWHRLHEDLGIGGGKRLIDFVPEAERNMAETEWGKMSAQQQAGTRKMFEEKQASYRPWREQYERDIAVPPAETKGEKFADTAGIAAGIIFSPDNLLALGRSKSVVASGVGSKAEDGTLLSAAMLTHPKSRAVASDHWLADDLIDSARSASKAEGADLIGSANGARKGDIEGVPADGAVKNVEQATFDPKSYFPKDENDILTKKQALSLPGEKVGLYWIVEPETHIPHAAAYEREGNGYFWSKKYNMPAKPSLRWDNPDGDDWVKFDHIDPTPQTTYLIILVDSKADVPPSFRGAEITAAADIR